ncbi:hypothetical protein ACIQCM_05795 [Pseudarthrobacter sp. NPDC092439]|uniref:hypothetical protein n=1 Tax=unclassified Pseudarthrobacter TaxID=2647000 RepID=UPI0037F1E898
MNQISLILSSDYARVGQDSRALSRRAASKELCRIRQGVYVAAKEWNTLKEWEQYPLLIRAAAATLQSRTVFCRESSAAVWGIPLLGTRQIVHALTADGGGGRSRAGVRRHRGDPEAADVQLRSGLWVTGRLRTVLDLAAFGTFEQGVAAVDHVLKPDPVQRLLPLTLVELEGSIGPEYSAAAARRIRKVLGFADPASGSPGESLSRAYMYMEGFKEPRLQTEIRDRRGFVALLDFEWPEEGLAGEFDGLVKYQKAEYLSGRTPSDVVVAEKRREDRIRAAGRRVIRWTWTDLADRAAFAAMLERAGVPRTRFRACAPDIRYGNGQPPRGST